MWTLKMWGCTEIVQCLCVSPTIITASIIVIIISHSCTFQFFPLPFSKSFVHFTRRCNKNCSMHTINNLQINDCIIQSASEVLYVNDMSCLTSIAKHSSNNNNNNDHVIQVKIAYILMYLMFFFRHFFLPLIFQFYRMHAFVKTLFSQCELKHSKKWSEYELLSQNVQCFVKNYTCSNITSSVLLCYTKK